MSVLEYFEEGFNKVIVVYWRFETKKGSFRCLLLTLLVKIPNLFTVLRKKLIPKLVLTCP